MTDKKKLFLDNELRCGGFYELCIQVCPSVDMGPVKAYTDFVYSLDNVEGPFDNSFTKTKIDIENSKHQGIVTIDSHTIPFITYTIREREPIETGYNWFDICFYTAAIEEVFGKEYTTWTENPNSPEPLDKFLHQIMKTLYQIYPFELAIIGFEVSGQYYFEDLKNEFHGWISSGFYIGKEKIGRIAEKNKAIVNII